MRPSPKISPVAHQLRLQPGRRVQGVVSGRGEDCAGEKVVSSYFRIVVLKGPRRPGKLVGVGLCFFAVKHLVCDSGVQISWKCGLVTGAEGFSKQRSHGSLAQGEKGGGRLE
jgi:hypothetical protein